MKGFNGFIFLLIFYFGCSIKNDESILDDGEYLVTYDKLFKETYEDFELEISGNVYEKRFKNGGKVKGRLQRLSGNKFFFRDENLSLDSSEFQKQLKGLGEPMIDLKQGNNDTIVFLTIFQGNLNLVINKGIIVKVDD